MDDARPKLTDYSRYADALAVFSRQRLWELFDGTRERLNISHECVDRHAVDPARVALRIAHADGSDRTITFRELSAASARFAHYLRKRGVQPGDRVGIMLEPSPEFYAALFGTMKLGAIGVPLFTLFGSEGLRMRIDDCGLRLLFVAPERLTLTPEFPDVTLVAADAALMESLRSFPDTFESSTRADDLAMYQYTSGTTRQHPEAIKHTHGAVVVVAVAALYGTGVRPADRFFCPSSPAWGHGLWHGTIAPLALGAETGAYAGRFDPERLLAALSAYRTTNLSAAATHYRMMRLSGAAPRYEYHIEKLSYTGEPIDSESLRFAEETFGTPVCSMYGTTEIGVVLANYPGAGDFAVKPGSLGKAVPGVQVEVHDAFGKPCAPNAIGEIKVWRKGAWFPTKDLGHVDADGYFYHDGRADDVIISAGWTMSAVEIEDIILTHPEVTAAAAIGIPDPIRGQIVKAFVVASVPETPAFVQAIQDLVRSKLSLHEYPRVVEFVADLPRTPAGKINRKVLRDAAALSKGPTP
jgi:acetyl-CoA synthetase